MKINKILSLLVAISMLFSVGITAMAEGDAPKSAVVYAYTSENTIWGQTWSNAKESYVIKVYSGETYMGQSSLNNIGGIIDGDVEVTWHIKLDAASNTDEYWTMSWEKAPSLNLQPTHVALVVDGVETSRSTVQLNGPDNLNKIYAATADADGKIVSYATSFESAVESATSGSTILMLRDETQEDGIKITDKNLTIDLCGNTFKVTEGSSTNFRNILINGNSVVSIKNGTLVAGGDTNSGTYGTIRTEGTANVTLTGLKLYNYRGNGLNIKACTGTNVKISDTEIYSTYGGGIEAAGATMELDNVTVKQQGMWTAPYNSMAISVNGGGTVTVNSGYYETTPLTAEEADNQGSSHGSWAAGVLNSGGKLIINGGTFVNGNYGDDSLATAARGLILADTGAVIEINGGSFKALRGIIDIQNNLGDAAKNPTGTIGGGTFSADPTNGYVKLSNDFAVKANSDGTYSVKALYVAKIGETSYATIGEAIATAKDGDTVVISAGEYGAIDIRNKNITIQGTVGDDGELLTTIKGGNPAIIGHSFNGTIKDIKIVDAFKVMYAEPAGNVTVDNVYVTGATYGFHLVACSTGLTWKIENSYMDLSWANSFGVDGNGDADIIIKGNEFVSTSPYYPDYGALHVNSFLPSVTVEENIFRENAKIKIDSSVTDTSKIKISGNYHAVGVENAFVDDSVKTVINTYYTNVDENGNLTGLVVVKDSADVATVNGVGYATLADAVAAANADDTVTVIADVADEAVEVNKNLTITGAVAANNVTINAVSGCSELTVSNLSFTGNSWINSGAADKLTVEGVTANVTPSNTAYTNSRSAFISLGRSEQKNLELTVKNCNIVSAGGSDPILGWAAVTKVTMTGNTFGSASAYQTNSDSVKFMAIAEGAVFNITGNTVYSNYNGFVFAQNTTRENAYTVNLENNTFIGGADHVWIEVSGSTTTNAAINASSTNTVNGNKFTAKDIKVHPNIKTWTSYAGVDVKTDANGKVIGGQLAYYAADAIAEEYEALLNLDGNYIVGKKPTATVKDHGATVIPANTYGVWNGSSYTSKSPVDMPLNFVVEFLADETAAEGAASPYADWYADFVITFDGIEKDSFVANGCYLAGHYGDFGWVKVPVDGMRIENGVRYPVMLGVGLGQKYDTICSSVQDFKCAMFLTPEILAANPNLKVKLELAMVDNSKGQDAARDAIINNTNVYSVTEKGYVAKDFEVEEEPYIFGRAFYMRNLPLENGNYIVNVYAGIDSLDYQEVGFKFYNEAGTQIGYVPTKTVYTSVKGTNMTVTAEQIESFRIFGVKAAFGKGWDNTPIIFQPYAIDMNGEEIPGYKYKITDIYTN